MAKQRAGFNLNPIPFGYTPQRTLPGFYGQVFRGPHPTAPNLGNPVTTSPPVTPGMWKDLGRTFTPGGWRGGAWRSRYARGLGNGGIGIGLGLNAAFGVAGIASSAISKSVEWGTTTGFQEDYAGGAVYGANLGIGRAVGSLIGEAAGTLLGAFAGPIGVMAGGTAGAIYGGDVGEFFTRRGAYEKGRLASFATAGAIAKRKVQFGRGFRDTSEAQTMRQLAVQEMAGSLLNSRQYLGNESYFFHN